MNNIVTRTSITVSPFQCPPPYNKSSHTTRPLKSFMKFRPNSKMFFSSDTSKKRKNISAFSRFLVIYSSELNLLLSTGPKKKSLWKCNLWLNNKNMLTFRVFKCNLIFPAFISFKAFYDNPFLPQHRANCQV